MAVGDYLPIIVSPLTDLSTTTVLPKSVSPLVLRRRLSPVATNNSSAFIRFPKTSRKSSAFVPVYQQRAHRSLLRPNLIIKDTQCASDISKTSNPAPSSLVSEQQKSTVSQKLINPILSNPLLNYRKQEPKPAPSGCLSSFSHTSKFCTSSKTPAKNRAHTVPLLAHQMKVISNEIRTPQEDEYENQEEVELFDQDKYEYVSRWLQKIRVTNHPIQTLPKIKQSKYRFVQS